MDRVSTAELLDEYKLATKDTSSANETKGKTRIRYYYVFLLSEAGNYSIERVKYGSAVDGQRSYLLAKDYNKMKNVRFKFSDVWYPLREVESLDEWHNLTARSYESSIPSEYIIMNEQGNLYLEMNPIPDANGSNNIELVYEGFQDPLLFPTTHSDGTISATNGSASIVGVSSNFTADMVGRFLRPTDGRFYYEVKSQSSATEIDIVNYFQENTIAGSTYEIIELLRTPPEFDYTPVWGAAMDYFLIAGNMDKAKEFERKYVRDLTLLQKKYQSKTKGRVMPGRRVGKPAFGRVPRNYPTSLLTTY